MIANELTGLLRYLTSHERAQLDQILTAPTRLPTWREIARAEQIAPDGDWVSWLILAGRGFGKTRTIVEWANEQALAMPGSWGMIAGATAGDVRDIIVKGESGFLNAIPEATRPVYKSSTLTLEWPNGTVASLMSADEPERFRGKQGHWAIADEVAAWRRPESWDMMLFGLRLGSRPRVAIATTPRPVKLIRKLLKDSTCHVTRGSTYDNRANLAPTFFAQIISRYEGTRLGRQELNAEVLEDVEGALWTLDMIDSGRVSQHPEMVRIVIGVDPKASVAAESKTGIVVVGRAIDGHLYVLEDASVDGSPDTWGRKVVTMFNKWSADMVIAEVNQGGDMVTSVLRTVDRSLPIKTVHASRGKYVRAEPIAALYEQGRAHHLGTFLELEEQMTTFVPGNDSPDNMDALVWAATVLSTNAAPAITDNPFYQ